MWHRSVPFKIGREEKNLQLTWDHSQGQQNLFFFLAIIHFAIFNAIISEFGACLDQNSIAATDGILGFLGDE